MSSWQDPEGRYLGITGVVMENESYRTDAQPGLEALKQEFFPHSPDEPVVLVRNQIVRKKGPSWRLQDPGYAEAWEERITAFFQKHIRRAFTVVIDKQAHRDRYGAAAWHPYHYCVTVLVERYRGWLKAVGGRGDVLAESRGGTADVQLKRVYRDLMDSGTYYRSPQELQDYLTSKEIKLKPKSANIAGLQLADLIAYPAKIDILQSNGCVLSSPPSVATRRIIRAIAGKYNQWGRNYLS
jgi:hypothetical protein